MCVQSLYLTKSVNPVGAKSFYGMIESFGVPTDGPAVVKRKNVKVVELNG